MTDAETTKAVRACRSKIASSAGGRERGVDADRYFIERIREQSP